MKTIKNLVAEQQSFVSKLFVGAFLFTIDTVKTASDKVVIFSSRAIEVDKVEKDRSNENNIIVNGSLTFPKMGFIPNKKSDPFWTLDEDEVKEAIITRLEKSREDALAELEKAKTTLKEVENCLALYKEREEPLAPKSEKDAKIFEVKVGE